MPHFSEPVWTDGQPDIPRRETAAMAARADLAIVGGGLLGLSAALHAARAGLGVQVLEKGRIGGQASGLNGGQVIPGFKFDPEALIRLFGAERGRQVLDFAAGTADAVFDLVARENLAVPLRRSGWIQACHTEKAMAAAGERYRQWKAEGADVALLSAGEIRALTGTDNYLGGFFDRRAGTVNPLALTRELARVAASAGAGIAEETEVAALRAEGGGWRLRLADGRELQAGKVLVATNAYADGLIPGLAESLVPLHSLQVATAPLPHHLQSTILPEGQAVSDSRRILVYYRRTEEGRLILGGRGPMREPSRPGDFAHLERALRRLFPALADMRIERRWFGRVCVTPDYLPHVHEPQPGLLAMAGCQGRGVGMMVAAGPRLADYLMSGDPAALPLPPVPIRPIPFHAFRQVGVGATIAWYRLLDALEG